MPIMNARVTLMAGLLIFAPIAHAQSPASPDTPTISTRSTLVLVPTLARQKSGALVYDLTADDFALTDDGVSQKLTLEQDTGGEPLALVVVIEAGAATDSAGWLPESRGASVDRFHSLSTMIEAIVGGVPHRIAVVGFDSQADVLQDFTSNVDAVGKAIQDFNDDVTDHGAAILDSLGLAVDLLRKQPPQYRRAILLLSETNDRGSQISLASALRAISDTNTAIYSVAFSSSSADTSHYAHKQLPTKRGQGGGITFENPDPFPASGCMGKDPSPDAAPQNKAAQAYDCLAQLAPPLAFAKMAFIAAADGLSKNIPETVARLTGGEYFKFSGAKSLERDLATISNHIPNRYMLSFQPHLPHPGLHTLTLQVKDRRGIALTARTSYWVDVPGLKAPAPPPPNPRKPDKD